MGPQGLGLITGQQATLSTDQVTQMLNSQASLQAGTGPNSSSGVCEAVPDQSTGCFGAGRGWGWWCGCLATTRSRSPSSPSTRKGRSSRTVTWPVGQGAEGSAGGTAGRAARRGGGEGPAGVNWVSAPTRGRRHRPAPHGGHLHGRVGRLLQHVGDLRATAGCASTTSTRSSPKRPM